MLTEAEDGKKGQSAIRYLTRYDCLIYVLMFIEASIYRYVVNLFGFTYI